jgi:hypothetical protein
MAELSQLTEAWNRVREIPVAENPLQMAPGIYFDIPFEDYVRIPGVNKSTLCQAKLSLAHYRWAPKPDDSPAFRFGSLIHAGKLEPEELAKRYVVLPDDRMVAAVMQEAAANGKEIKSPKATSHYKALKAAFLATHPGKQEVSQEWFDNMVGILKSLEANPIATDLFSSGFPEVTIIWDHPVTWPKGLGQGDEHNIPATIRCKGRIDWLTADGALVDLKTTDDVFGWSVDKFDYHIQAASYLEGYKHAYMATPKSKRKGIPKSAGFFWFVVAEKKQPWTVLAAPASPLAVKTGLEEYEFLLQQVAAAQTIRADGGKMVEAWPQAQSPAAWELSRWFRPNDYPLWQDRKP